jgi:ElaB/YqjD/DUF883 family membrane-anchored ribosome-binding protein
LILPGFRSGFISGKSSFGQLFAAQNQKKWQKTCTGQFNCYFCTQIKNLKTITMKKFFAILAVAGMMVACNDSATTENKTTADTTKAGGIADDAQKAADTANKTMTNAADTAKGMMNKATDTAKGMMNKAVDGVKDAVKDAGNKAVDAGKDAVKDAGNKAVQGVKDAIKKN